MPTADHPHPTNAELEILTVLWTSGPGTVRQVHERINERRPAQYSTVLKFLQIMAEEDLLCAIGSSVRTATDPCPQEMTQKAIGRSPSGTRLQRLRKSAVGGCPFRKEASKSELAESHKLLDEYAKRAKWMHLRPW